MGTQLPRLDRRQFVLGSASFVLLAMTGCARPAAPPAAAEDADAERVARLRPPAAPPELDTNEPRHVEEARAWLVVVPEVALARARVLVPRPARSGLDHALLALSDVCPKEAIQLRWCESARWFWCPACGSQFDPLGGAKAGPAMTGMSFHRVTVDDQGEVNVDAKPLLPGLVRNVLLAAHEPAGPFCG